MFAEQRLVTATSVTWDFRGQMYGQTIVWGIGEEANTWEKGTQKVDKLKTAVLSWCIYEKGVGQVTPRHDAAWRRTEVPQWKLSKQSAFGGAHVELLWTAATVWPNQSLVWERMASLWRSCSFWKHSSRACREIAPSQEVFLSEPPPDHVCPVWSPHAQPPNYSGCLNLCLIIQGEVVRDKSEANDKPKYCSILMLGFLNALQETLNTIMS